VSKHRELLAEPPAKGIELAPGPMMFPPSAGIRPLRQWHNLLGTPQIHRGASPRRVTKERTKLTPPIRCAARHRLAFPTAQRSCSGIHAPRIVDADTRHVWAWRLSALSNMAPHRMESTRKGPNFWFALQLEKQPPGTTYFFKRRGEPRESASADRDDNAQRADLRTSWLLKMRPDAVATGVERWNCRRAAATGDPSTWWSSTCKCRRWTADSGASDPRRSAFRRPPRHAHSWACASRGSLAQRRHRRYLVKPVKESRF